MFQSTPNPAADRFPELVVLASSLTLLGNPTGTEISELQIFTYDSLSAAFSSQQQIPIEGGVPAFFLANMDFDRLNGQENDRDLDLMIADYTGGKVQFLTNQQNTGWETQFHELALAENPRTLIAADFDRDGDEDILFSRHFQDTLSLLITPPDLFKPPNDGLLIDFGDVFVGDTVGVDVPFGINTTLDLQVQLTLQDSIHFSALPQSFVLENGHPRLVRFTFQPADTIFYQTLTLVDTDHPLQRQPGVITLRGQGVAAHISVQPLLLDFGIVPPGFTKTLDLQVRNSGNGSLVISDWEHTLPQFQTPATPASVDPHSSQVFPISFAPDTLGQFRDTLYIVSNDRAFPRVAVVLTGQSSDGKPVITSPDTVTAVEHQFFSYQVTAEDPEGQPLTFFYFNLTDWLQVRADSVFGTPPEGASDTQFRIIASDGFLQDTLNVYVRVIPVNDPPVFTPVPPQVVTELENLTFNVIASDPENEPIEITAENLPTGAQFSLPDSNRGEFSWSPPLGSAGTYLATFKAQEKQSKPPLSAMLTVEIQVIAKKPDLQVRQLRVFPEQLHRGETGTIEAVLANREAPITGSFRVQLQVDGSSVFDSTLSGMALNEEIPLHSTARFTRVGQIPVSAEIDIGDAIAETDETNNRLEIIVPVEPGRLIVRPNPFTPNGDTKNDQAGFDMQQLTLTAPRLTIFDINGRVIRSLNRVRNHQFLWDGRDNDGKEMLPGVYLYVLQDGSKNVAKGYVVLAR